MKKLYFVKSIVFYKVLSVHSQRNATSNYARDTQKVGSEIIRKNNSGSPKISSRALKFFFE